MNKNEKNTKTEETVILENKTEETKKERVEVVFILDRSGSMGGLEADTIGGFNAMLKQQQEEGNDIIWSTVLFDHMTEVLHDRVPVDKVQPLNEDTYFVRGSTALLDAVGGAIHHIGNVHKYARPEDRPDKTLVVITTDGMENASHIYSYDKVKRMIKKEQEKYGWEFIFLGANIDAAEAAGHIGIAAERSANFHADGAGVEVLYRNVGRVATKISRGGSFVMEDLAEVRDDYEKRKKNR